MMRDFLYGPFIGGRAAFGMFLLRALAGAGLMFHGWPKIQNPTGWMGPNSTVPDYMQALSAVAEFGGGAALVLGFLTPIAALLIIGNMIGALWLVHVPAGHPFVSTSGGSMELPGLYLATGLLYFFAGPGTWSLDALMLGGGRMAIEERAPTELHLDHAA
jgi:putative oxidoreductase